MHVDFDKTGCLCIHGETAVEQYALTHWYEQWKQGKSVFLVQTVERADDGSGALDASIRTVKENR